jgi:hypothetical protein
MIPKNHICFFVEDIINSFIVMDDLMIPEESCLTLSKRLRDIYNERQEKLF